MTNPTSPTSSTPASHARDGAYDLDAVRARFPALASGTAHFDGPGGSQVPREVADAIADTLTSSIANVGSVSAAERRARHAVEAGRAAIADLVGGEARGVVFGRSMTELTFHLARTLADGWGPDDEVVVTRLDHDANIRPWVRAAERAGATVRWAPFDPTTAELDVEQIRPLLGERTRLVAVTGASNLLGTRPDVAAIAAAAHEVGALVHVDGVHLTAHASVDVRELGADLFACSPYKFLGPHHGALVADPALLETLRPDKLLPSTDAVPERFELGTLPYELLAGTAAAVDVLAAIGAPHLDEDTPRRDRLAASFAAIEAHEQAMVDRLDAGLDGIEGVIRYSRAADRTPTTLFRVEGVEPRAVHEHLATMDVNAPASHFYALEASRWLGLGDDGGVRAGMAPYTSADEVDRLLEGVAEVARER
ncbi:MAG: cysteine desulfurase-like protein [Nitriliruptoraceae bacterium]|nr:cysteine desulfurase-like protein [Nitriliruptoraceae bacterium]